MDGIITPELTNGLLEIAGLILSLILSMAALTLRKKFGIEIELKKQNEITELRWRLDETIRRAVRSAMLQAEDGVMTRVDLAIDYLIKSSGETLTTLGADTPVGMEVLRKRVEVELDEETRRRAANLAGAGLEV